jgi:hypothetical protein
LIQLVVDSPWVTCVTALGSWQVSGARQVIYALTRHPSDNLIWQGWEQQSIEVLGYCHKLSQWTTMGIFSAHLLYLEWYLALLQRPLSMQIEDTCREHSVSRICKTSQWWCWWPIWIIHLGFLCDAISTGQQTRRREYMQICLRTRVHRTSTLALWAVPNDRNM